MTNILEETEYTIRNILGLHLNNFYQENGLSVPCKVRTAAEDKIIAALKEEFSNQREELLKAKWLLKQATLSFHPVIDSRSEIAQESCLQSINKFLNTK